jgi:hypothetical protein
MFSTSGILTLGAGQESSKARNSMAFRFIMR